VNPITDDETLHRRIHPIHVKPDGNVSSAAFNDPQMSVDRASLRSADETLHGYDGYGLAAFAAKNARDLEQEVLPAPDLLNPAHALVKGKKTKKTARAFAKLSRLLRRPHAAPPRERALPRGTEASEQYSAGASDPSAPDREDPSP
jgi:hypothetical protein